MVKLSLVAAFVMTMATLTFAASGIPAPEAELAAPVTVASIDTESAKTFRARPSMPLNVSPASTVELMATL